MQTNHNTPCKQRAKCCRWLLGLTGAAVCVAAGCLRPGSVGVLGAAASSLSVPPPNCRGVFTGAAAEMVT